MPESETIPTSTRQRSLRKPERRVVPVGYIARRLGQLVLIVFVAMSLNFAIPRLIPGDPIQIALGTKAATSGSQSTDILAIAEKYQAKFGLDTPLWTQYYNYWNDIVHGEFGISIAHYPTVVSEMITSALPWTIGLLAVSTIIGFVLGSLLGGLLAWPRAPLAIRALAPGLMVLSVIPYFLLAIILIYLFSMQWNVFPPGGGFTPTTIPAWNWNAMLDVLEHALLPGLSLVLVSVGSWALAMRGMMVSILGEDYITLAEAKGLKGRRIFLWYGMRNAILPQLTLLAVAVGFILSGAVLVEVVFNYPGIGNVLFQAIQQKDYFVIQGVVLMLIFSLAFSLFVVDILLPLVDPRIRYQRR